MTTSERAPGGAAHLLRVDGHEAIVLAVGATLCSYRVDGRDLVVPFDLAAPRPLYSGATLAPWPNRVVDGRYVFDGVARQLPLTEPDRGHALHGLVAWLDFETVSADDGHVTLSADIVPQDGYPWRVRVETTFVLDGRGLTQTVRGTNLSDTAAPWGTGPHPYLTAGGDRIDEATLSLPAARVLTVTEDRLVPVETVDVDTDADRFDFRAPRAIGDVRIDHAFTGLDRDAEGWCTVSITGVDGSGASIRWDRSCPWVQVHTADRPEGDGDPRHRRGLAVEPMTCPPDAFNSGVDLVRLEPGATSAAGWTIAPVVPSAP